MTPFYPSSPHLLMFKRSLAALVALLLSTSHVAAQSYGSAYGGNLVNRAEMAKLALESAGVPPGGSNCFSDVKNEWFAGYVCAGKNRGIVTGFADGRFRPANAVSFVEAGAIALRAHGIAVRQDAVWYRPHLEKLSDLDAVPRSVTNLFHPVNRSQVDEMLAGIRDGDTRDDDDDDDDDSDNDGDIRITIDDDDDPVDADDTITYTITIENRGDDDDEIDVTAFLDEDMTFVSASDDGDENGDEVEWENVEVDEDDEEELTLKVRLKSRVDDGDTVRLRVEAGDAEVTETTEVDDDGDDDDDNDDIDVTVSDSSDEVEPGDEITYSIRIENDGDDDERVDVLAFLDDETNFISASDGGDEEGDEVEWLDILVREDSSKTLTLRVRVASGADDGDTLSLRVEVDDLEEEEETDVEDEDDDDDDDDDDVTITITDSDDPVEIGDIVTYRIRLANDGNDDARVDLRAILDDGMSYTSSTDGGDLQGNDTVEWEDIEVDEDSDKTILLRVRINNSAEDGEELELVVESDSEEATETTEIED
jgi:uncharacterized repeat protein (TIGR01451 family)